MFSITRIYAGNDGESYFEDINVVLHDRGSIGFLSDKMTAGGIIFREVPPDYDYEFHTAPQRQYIILLDGEIEIETSLGEKRRFRGGDIILAEDTTGKGHRTRNIKKQIRKSIFVTL